MDKQRKVTPKAVVEILNEYGTNISFEEAQSILNLAYNLAHIVVSQKKRKHSFSEIKNIAEFKGHLSNIKQKRSQEHSNLRTLYPAPESNRHGFPQVFETSASTNSASWASYASESGLVSQKRAANVAKLSLIRNRYFCRK